MKGADRNVIPQPKRPWLVTAFCVLAVVRIFLTMMFLMSPTTLTLGTWYPVFLSIMALLLIGIMMLFWRMRRWGVWALAAHTAVFAGVFLLLKQPNPEVVFFVPLWGLLAGAIYYKRMV
jgi:hypothetical protein